MDHSYIIVMYTYNALYIINTYPVVRDFIRTAAGACIWCITCKYADHDHDDYYYLTILLEYINRQSWLDLC